MIRKRSIRYLAGRACVAVGLIAASAPSEASLGQGLQRPEARSGLGFHAPKVALLLGVTPADESPELPATSEQSVDCLRTLRLPWGPVETCRQAVITASLAGVGLIAYTKWWRKGFSRRWTTAHEGWFRRETYAGGIDKLSHGYSLYVGTRLLTRALDWAGDSHDRSVRTAAIVGLGTALAVEMFDGLSKKAYGFSKEDLISGALGVGLAVLMETRPALDRLVAFRMMYRSSVGPGRMPQPLDDYEHQVYLLAFRLSGISSLGPRNPLRFVELVAGYGATGYHDDGGSPFEARRRVLYLGVGIDLTKVAQRLFFPKGGGTAEAFTTETLRYLQPPGTVLWSKSTL